MGKLRVLPALATAFLACACAAPALDTAAAAQPQREHRAQNWPHGQRQQHGRRSAERRSATRARSMAAHSRLQASLASVLGTPCANIELTPTADDLPAIQAATLCLVNQERARDDEPPLLASSRLEQAAQGHSEEMLSADYFAHVAPDGTTPVGRIQATGYVPNRQVGYTLGENLAWGTLQLSTPSAIVAAWIASPEHLANILFGQYRDTAIGVVPAVPSSLAEGQPGAIYTQEFGVIVR
jgi:uncharacterized protein YkwD